MMKSAIVFGLAGLSSFTNAAPTNLKRGGAGKKGLAFGKGDAGKSDLFKGSSSWGYNWEAQLLPGFSDGMEYVPMLHDNQEVFTSGFEAFVDEAVKRGTKHVLSINEPDQCGGGGTCMDVATAVQTHKDVVGKVADKYPDVKIGSIAVTNGGEATKGINYLTDFMNQCDGCRIDFVCAHWYAVPNLQNFKDHMTDVHSKTNKPVWVTEFRSEGDDQQFLTDAMAWMDSQDWIERYAYMSVDESLAPGGSLSAIGSTYNS